ncbi:MAG: F0F1 ATP synthase subunit alpha, partial [Patescibacteria group bacterium]|nr:F0F1 ATP synthase subunit alpha [Patescibacteria group bacterium]
MADFLEQFEKELRGFVPKPRAAQGVVLRAQDGIAEVDGLRDVVPGELVRFEPMGALNDVFGEPELSGLVLNLEEDVVRIVVLGDAARVREGMVVLSGGDVLSVPVGDALIGRIVSPLGEPLDGAGPVDTAERRPVERVAPGVMEREGVNTPLHTGIKAIDAMIPIGRGQRELIVGDRYTGKTTIAIDTILNQKSEPKDSRPICIYVAIGQKESKTARLVQLLRERGALEYTVIVNAGASASAALQYLAPFAGAAIGEYFMESGRDALVVYDDLSKHAVAYRQLSLLLRRPPGREAYPGDVFYLHSRL